MGRVPRRSSEDEAIYYCRCEILQVKCSFCHPTQKGYSRGKIWAKKLTSRAVSSSPASSALTLSSRRVALGTVVANAALSTSSSELTWRTSCNSKTTTLLVSGKSQPFKFKSDVQILLLLLLLWLMMLLHPCTKIGLEIDEVALNARKCTCGYFKLHLSWKIATSSH